MTDPPSTPRPDRSTAVAIYLAAAAVLGIVMALDVLPTAAVFGLNAVYGITSVIFRHRVLHAGPWSKVDIAGGLAFAAAFLPVALLLRHWPFR